MKIVRYLYGIIIGIGLLIGNTSYGIKVLAIPGLGKIGSESDYVAQLIGVNESDVIQVEVPGILRDLGQNRCMKFLDKALKELNEPCIIHASSQGGGTVLNYLPKMRSNVKAVILEAPIVTANSAIQYTTSGDLMRWKDKQFPKVGTWPLAYYWLPYASKIIFPNYSPSGIQPIHAIKNIPHEIPVIIIHSKDDQQISFDDACALYYGLRQSGKQHVYFVQMVGMAHLNLVGTYDKEVLMQIRAILAKHGILKEKYSMHKDIQVQPDHTQYEVHYHSLLEKEKKHWLIARLLRLGGGLGVLSFAGWLVIKELVKLSNGYEGHGV